MPLQRHSKASVKRRMTGMVKSFCRVLI